MDLQDPLAASDVVDLQHLLPPTHSPSITVSSVSTFLTAPCLTQHTPRLRPQIHSPLILIPFLISQSLGFKYNLCTDRSHIYTCNLAPDLPLHIPSCSGHPSNRHRADMTRTETPRLSLDLFLPHSPQPSKWHLLPSTCLGQTLRAMLNCSLALIQHNQSLSMFSTVSSQ